MYKVLKESQRIYKNNNSILKTSQRLKSERHSIFSEEINQIALSSNDDKMMQPIDLIETYAYGRNKNQVSKQGEIKCNNIIKGYNKWLTLMMLQRKTSKKIIRIDHPYRILIIGSSVPGKSKSLFNLKNQQQVIDKICLYAKDPYEVKYQFVIDKQSNYSKAFIEYSSDMDYI